MKRIIQFIPLIILSCAVLYSGYVINTTNIILGVKQYLGIAFVIGGILLTFVHRDWTIYFLGIGLLFGTFNFIAFTPSIEYYSFSFNDKDGIDITIQPFSFLVLVVYLIINYKPLFKLIRKTSNA
jgi:hypothetical protein